jgi:hypothetical protein
MRRSKIALERSRPSGHNASVAEKTPKRPRDLNQWAKRMVDIATGEVEADKPNTATPMDIIQQGAQEGGRRRAEVLTPEERTKIARNAAQARWKSR